MTTVESVKDLESKLAAARETARAGLIKNLEATLEELRAIGFDYDYVTHQNGKPKGRPRKEAQNGVVHEGKLQPKA
jgi:hypothetical protein